MAKFKLGKIVATSEIEERMKREPTFNIFISRCLGMFKHCNWGVMPEEDKPLNDSAVKLGKGRVHGAYIYSPTGEKIWIITESDRSTTTILYPYQY